MNEMIEALTNGFKISVGNALEAVKELLPELKKRSFKSRQVAERHIYFALFYEAGSKASLIWLAFFVQVQS